MNGKNLLNLFLILSMSLLVQACSSFIDSSIFSSEKSTSFKILHETAESQLTLGTRQYVVSSLDQIFGSTAQLITMPLIQAEPIFFGGPCDNFNPAICPIQNERELSQLTVLPSAVTARSALVLRACDKIVSDDVAILYAVAQAKSVASITEAEVKDVTDADVSLAYDLFYPGKKPSSSAAASLKDVATKGKALDGKSISGWRFLFLVLCMSPDWQII